jgi:hypothetical protein
MLIYSMSVSVDGFIADREGAFGWTDPNEEQFRFHIAQTRELGGCLCGRRLYETILPWETDASMRDNELGAAFADVWCAIPKVVFSRTLDSVQGNAQTRLPCGYRPTDDRPVRALDGRPGGSYRRVLAYTDASAAREVRRRLRRWSTVREITPSRPDHASTSGPMICPRGQTLQITRRMVVLAGRSRRFR